MEGGFIFRNDNTSNLSASTTPTDKLYFFLLTIGCAGKNNGSIIFRNGNASSLSASTTPTCKFYFCSQTLAVVVKIMGMYKWAPLNPI